MAGYGDAPVQTPVPMNLTNYLSTNIERLVSIRGTLRRTSERLFGPTPEQINKDVRATAPCVAAQMEDAFHIVGEIEALVSRLEDAVGTVAHSAQAAAGRLA